MKADLRRASLAALLLALVPAVAALPSCRSASGKTDAADATAKEKPLADADSDKDDAEKDDLEILKKERELAYSRMELAVAKLSVEAESREGDEAIRDAEESLALARNEMEEFEKVDREKSIARSDLSLDRGKWSREMSAQELGELQAMYQAEEFAQLTKELVLTRGQKSLEFAERDLALDRKDAAQLREYELPRKEKELARKVAKAERALADARAKKGKGDIERELKLLRATNAVDEAERELAKLKRDVEKKRAKKAKEAAEKATAAAAAQEPTP